MKELLQFQKETIAEIEEIVNMKKIKLTQGKYALVDDDDYKILKEKKWCISTAGYKNKLYYALTNCKGKNIYMHHVIMWKPKKMQIDHINGNGLDNRKENLRIVTASQNRWNMRCANGFSRFKGVYFDERGIKPRWNARIWQFNKQISLGTFRTEKEAAEAYNRAAEKLFGEYANPNKI